MKTIKQIADEIGVSKQAVRDKIAKLSLQSTLRKNGNHFAIDEKQEAAIKQAFEEKSQSEIDNQSTSETQSTLRFENSQTDRLIDMLQAELNMKNKQIDELNARLAEAHAIINREQILHSGTMQQQLIGLTEDIEPQKKISWFKRIFKKI